MEEKKFKITIECKGEETEVIETNCFLGAAHLSNNEETTEFKGIILTNCTPHTTHMGLKSLDDVQKTVVKHLCKGFIESLLSEDEKEDK